MPARSMHPLTVFLIIRMAVLPAISAVLCTLTNDSELFSMSVNHARLGYAGLG